LYGNDDAPAAPVIADAPNDTAPPVESHDDLMVSTKQDVDKNDDDADFMKLVCLCAERASLCCMLRSQSRAQVGGGDLIEASPQTSRPASPVPPRVPSPAASDAGGNDGEACVLQCVRW
jgi:hypothetical protein